jgi:hypothetical protein
VTQDTARAALRTSTPVVVIEAPAGCGKTHEAASLAVDLGSRLGPHQEILILAHTNAAVQEFRDRVRKADISARAMTFDSFAFEIVSMYAGPLGLPSPLRVDDTSGVTFALLAPKALELLRRAPSVSRALAGHYPFVILDEHQDARVEQDAIARQLAQQGSRLLRIFGDPMQAIFEQDSAIDWEAIKEGANVYDELDEPRRWDRSPDLGKWILRARRALVRGQPVSLNDRPGSIRVAVVPNLRDPHPRSEAVQPALIAPLYRLLDRLPGSLAMLVRYNRHAKALRVATRGRLVVNEGVELPFAYSAIERAELAVGDRQELVLAFLGLLEQTSTGLRPKLKALHRCFTPSACLLPRSAELREFVATLGRLYDSPDLPTWSAVLRDVLAAPPSWMRIQLPESLRALARLRVVSGEPAVMALDRIVRYRKEAGFVPQRCASTIHKVKGRAFDHVIIPYCGSSSFPNSELGQRLLYVALSRARHTITVLIPEANPSPLIGGRS